jgi:geranylgeranyl pyrophosphate synthase
MLYSLTAGGKHIRPILGLLLHRALGGKMADFLLIGIAIEIIHTSSLIIDDIMDEGIVRRGKKSVYARYGKARALLISDYMIARAIEMLLEAAKKSSVKTEALVALTEGGANLIEGQWLDLELERKKYITFDEYLEMIYKKTLQFFEYGAFISGVLANSDKRTIARLKSMGRNIGMLFQIRDDILDYIGTEKLGKGTFKDLWRGKRTAPIVMLRPFRVLLTLRFRRWKG